MKKEKECPACELINLIEADTCKHCGTAFFFEVECLEPKFDDPADELVVVGQFSSIVDAYVVRGLLEEHGIAALVPKELAPRILGFETATVRVARKDFEMVQRIIAATNNT